jgi:diaminopimelate epimerase
MAQARCHGGATLAPARLRRGLGRTTRLHSRRVEFEKWNALGNDYVILESAALPFELTPARIRAVCAEHSGLSSDGVLLVSEPDEPGFVARLRIYNPDGSEAEMSGNGSREAILYLRRHGWAQTDTFSIQTAAGEIRPTITSPTTCTVDIGRARLRSADYPSGPDDGDGELSAGEHSWRFQHVQVGNPQCVIEVSNERELAALDLPAIGPGIERHTLFPNRTNVSWWTAVGSGRIRARIFERGVGETASSGTGATGAAVAYVLDGGDSPVTVVLDGGELIVEVGEDLHIDLTGWAVPVFRGTLADEFVKELHETE